MTWRQLASVQTIVSLAPIAGADKIETVTVLGWQCVVAKSDGFKVGDRVVYIEVDSILPERKEFEFLRERKFRIKTIKLRSQISQGIVFPLTILPKGTYNIGQDVTDLLGVKKYDPQGDLERQLAADQASWQKNRLKRFFMRYNWFRRLFKPDRMGFPSFIKKTDEPRIQLFPDICEREKDTPFCVTEKLDGTSATFFLVKKRSWFRSIHQFGVCSRNLFLPKPDQSSYWTIARDLNIEKTLRDLIGEDDYVVLQGEIIGSGIQGNKYKQSGYQFYAFNLITPRGQLQHPAMVHSLNRYSIQAVPLLEPRWTIRPTIPECVEYAKGNSLLATVKREGVVVRNLDKGISFKIANPDFLLEYAE